MGKVIYSIRCLSAFLDGLVVPLVVIAALLFGNPSRASTIPSTAKQHQALLVRSAHAVWGLDAPIATFAAQVHQESAWNAGAKSKVGAQGIAQFMPGTAAWIVEIYPDTLTTPQPYNPAWALRAMVTYDLYLHKRNQARSPCDHWAMTLASYNGGLGWVQRDRRLASASGADPLAWFNSIERFNAGRSLSNFKENRDYPRKILLRWEPLYINAGWGNGVCNRRASF